MRENKQTFQPCFFCRVPQKVTDCEFMFQGQPVCWDCQAARRYVAQLCTPIKQYLGLDPDWRSQVNPNRKNTARRIA